MYLHEELDKHLELPKNAKILDLGCGEGKLLARFKKKGYKVQGVEKDETCPFVESVSNNIQIVDMVNILLPDEEYNVVIFSFSLMFVKKEERIFQIGGAYNSLKLNGYLYIGIMNEYDNGGCDKISQKEIIEWLKSFNFKVELWKRELVHDKPHRGMPKPHTHNVTHLLLKKYKTK